VIETRYKAWGEVRWTTESKTLPTRYTFTGQYSYISDSATDLSASASFGLMFYNARWYDPTLGRMAQADTIVPGGVQGLDRYAYVGNNPVRYSDPSGHIRIEEPGSKRGCSNPVYCENGQPRIYPPVSPTCQFCHTLPPICRNCHFGTGYFPSYSTSTFVHNTSTYFPFIITGTPITQANGITLNYRPNGRIGVAGAGGAFGLNPAAYKPGTIKFRVAKSLVVDAPGLAISAGLSIVENVYDYSYGEHADEGIGQEFLVSTTVDFTLSVAIGVVAATAAAIVFTAPLAIVVSAMFIGFALTSAADYYNVDGVIESWANSTIDSFE